MSDNPTPASETEQLIDALSTELPTTRTNRFAAAKKLRALQAENERLITWVNDLQSGMYINCVYCGHRYGPNKSTPTSMAQVLKEHVGVCLKHPMSELKAENERLREWHQEAVLHVSKQDGDLAAVIEEYDELKAANAALVTRVAKLEGVALDYQKTLCSMGEHSWTDYSEGAYCKACGAIKK